jgi:hypothetical protein
MPLLTGNWSIVAAGHEGTLSINIVQPGGFVEFQVEIGTWSYATELSNAVRLLG